MPVIYGGNSLRPAPQVSISVPHQLSGDGRKLGSTVSVRLIGTLTAEKTDDTYTPLTINQRLSKILEKQAGLRSAFAQDGQLLEIQGYDGLPPMKFVAIVDSIDFAEGPWTDKSDYTITLHGDGIAGENLDATHCDSASETWTFDEGDQPQTWKATHSVSARGHVVYDETGRIPTPAWRHAKDFVTARLGLGWTTAGDATWSPDSGQSIAAQSAVPLPSAAWNRVVTETVDELEGSYSVTETWTLNADPHVDRYTITARRTADEPLVTTVASISGVITGLRQTMGVNFDKYAAALAWWQTAEDTLASRCQEAVAAIGGATLNPHPTAVSVDHDKYNGTISYQYDFNDRAYVNDTFETYTIAKSASAEDYRTTVRIEGTITGVAYLDEGPSTTIKYTRAALQWDVVRGMIFARAVSESGVAGLKPFPTTAEVTPDEFAGTVSYHYEFDDRDPDDVRHEFTVSQKYSYEEGYSVSIEGTITALRVAHPDNPFGTGDPNERFDIAKAYYDGISGNLLGLAATYLDFSCVNPTPFATSLSFNPLAGTLSYSSQYNSMLPPRTPGVLMETVSISDEDAVPMVAILPVPGRARGPIMQDLRTVKEKRRTVTFEIVMQRPRYNCIRYVYPPIVDLSPYMPVGNPVYKDMDQTQWIPMTGRYTRTVAWIYE